MTPEVATLIVAIIGGGVTIISSLLGAFAVARRATNDTLNARFADQDERITKNHDSLTAIALKTDVLWDIYGVDAIRSARDTGAVKQNSPMRVSADFKNTVSTDVYEHVVDCLQRKLDRGLPVDVAVAQAVRGCRAEIKILSSESKTDHKIIFGVLLVLAKELRLKQTADLSLQK